MRMTSWYLVIFFLITSADLALAAKSAPALIAETILQENSYRLVLNNDVLSGTAVPFLDAKMENAQFLALGEEHNNMEIPKLTAALFQLYNEKYGFQFLMLEQDPVMMRRVSAKGVRGDIDSVHQLARNYPSGFTYISDQELQMIADVGAIGDTRANAIWGCEQAFGVTHILDELLELAPTADAKKYIVQAREKTFAVEKNRNLDKGLYIADHDLKPLTSKLRELFANPSDESAFLIDAIDTSNTIFGYHKAGSKGKVPGYYSNNFVRENYMISRCLEEYEFALQKDNDLPKGIMKFGHWHLFHGLSPAKVPSLGNFMSNFAKSHHKQFFSISIQVFNDEYPFAENKWSAYLKPLAKAANSNEWTLVDLSAFREYPVYNALLKNVEMSEADKDKFSDLVYGFDAVLLMGGASDATYEISKAAY